MATTTTTELDELCIATIRTLCIDAIQPANSGHPGNADRHRSPDVSARAAVPALRPCRPRSGRTATATCCPLAAKLQSDGAKSFVDSWNDLIAHIDEQSAALRA
jgi:Transketolase, thiamine diphosphate binding domain